MRNIQSGEMFFRKRKRKSALSSIAITADTKPNNKLRLVNQSNQPALQHSEKRRYNINNNNNNNNNNISYNYLTSTLQPQPNYNASKLCLSLTALIILVVTFTANSMIFISSQNVVHQVNAAKVLVEENNFEQVNGDKTRGNIIARACFEQNKSTSCVETATTLPALQVVDRADKGSEKIAPTMNQIGWPSVEEGNKEVLARSRRSTAAADREKAKGGATTRIVAVAGQLIELQCPLASELFALTNSNTNSKHSDRSIVWRKNGAKLNPLNPRHKINSLNGSLIITSAQPQLDEASYECALIRTIPKVIATGAAIGDDLASEQQQQQEEEEADSSKRHNFELKLIMAPQVAPFEFPTNARVGMRVELICSILEGQQPISFVWLKDNQIIEPSSHQLSSGMETSSIRNANSLSQLHRQQLADKFSSGLGVHSPSSSASSSTSSASRKSEYVIIVDQSSTLQDMNDSQQQQHQTKRLTNDGESTMSKDQQLFPLLSDSNILTKQSEYNSILSIEALELKHSGRYTCSVQNEAGRASHSSQLVINAPPSFTIEPKDGNLVSGESSMIDCAASGQPRPTISWLRARESNTKGLLDYLPVYDNLRFSTLANGSLVINNVTQREQGYYICSARNGFGPEMTKLIKITVHEPARFSSKYKTVEVRIEDRANMICAASGELPINIEWFDKDGNKISKNDKKFIIDNENSEDKGNDAKTVLAANKTVSRLILARSSRADSGHYICIASNKYGSDKMITNLLVQDVPDKVTELKVTNATSTTISLRWQLAFSGNSPVTSYLVQYQSDDPLDDLLISSSGPLKVTDLPANDDAAAASTPSATGELNSQQRVSQVQSLQTLSKQQPSSSSLALKTALDALNIASNLAENADEAIDRTLVELTVEQSSTHLIVKDLSPYCVYRLRLAGINKIGLGEFSDWIRAKTEEAPPGGVALKIIATATGPNSIKITWNPPDRRLWNGPLIGFNIGYRPIDSSFELNKTIEWTPPTLQSIMLDADKQQQQTKIKQQFQMVQRSLMMEQQSNISQVQHNSNMLNSNTTTTTVASLNTTATTKKPEVEYSKYILRQHLRQLLALQQQELVAHLTNLQRSTTYLVWIQAINNRGFGPQSHTITVKTLDDVPPSAPAIKIQSTTPSSITIAWSMLSNFISPANQYSLFYRRVPQLTSQLQQNSRQQQLNSSDQFTMGPMDNLAQPILHLAEPGPFIERTISSKQLMLNGNMFLGNSMVDPESILSEVKPSFLHQQSQHYQQFVYTLDQLECGSVYELYMTTRNSVGKSEPSSIVTTRTLGEPPMAPMNKNSLFSKIGINDVILNLASWSTGGCPLTHITVRYKQSPIPVASATSISSQQQQQQSQNSSSSLAFSWPITINLPANILDNINSAQNGPTSNKAYLSSNHLNQEDHQLGHELSLTQQQQQQQQPIYLLKNLLPSTCYELEISAYNTAGHTMAQYEFVTSNLNGTRSGYSRKEGVFKIDQRINNQYASDTHQQQQSFDSSRILEQQASFKNNSGTASQIVPLILMILCFVCLIISSTFCYYRLKDNWKNQTSRSLSDTSSSAGAGSSRGGLHCQQVNSSPNSIGGKSSSVSMWRGMNGGARSTLRHQQHQSSTQQSHLEEDSPTAMHYCLRDPTGNQMLSSSLIANQSGKNLSSSFSQSVSMKDFNLIQPQSHLSTCPTSQHQSGNTSTLKYKNYRSSIRPLSDAKHTSNTLRARLNQSMDNYDQIRGGPVASAIAALPTSVPQGYNSSTLGHNQLCSAYAAVACKQKQLEQAAYINTNSNNNGQLSNNGGADYATNDSVTPYDTHQYMYTTNGGVQAQQAETSWTNFESNQACLPDKLSSNQPTNYAVPQPTYSDQAGNYNNTNQLNYQQENNYDENSIDACIQHLMSQQYQQQQYEQQQQYAMIVNLKVDPQNNKCVYNGAENVDYELQNGVAQNQSNINQAKVKTVSGQSVVDSSGSSGSSGIDIGTHLDCGSSVTGTSNSNNSNGGYQLSQPSSEGEKFDHDNSNGNTVVEQISQQQQQQQFQ